MEFKLGFVMAADEAFVMEAEGKVRSAGADHLWQSAGGGATVSDRWDRSAGGGTQWFGEAFVVEAER